MTPDQFMQIIQNNPKLSPIRYGPERSFVEIVHHHYSDHFFPMNASLLTIKYFTELYRCMNK